MDPASCALGHSKTFLCEQLAPTDMDGRAADTTRALLESAADRRVFPHASKTRRRGLWAVLAVVAAVAVALRVLGRRRKYASRAAKNGPRASVSQGFRPHRADTTEGGDAGPGQADASWLARVETPRYDAEMLLQWRVVTWAVRYAVSGLLRRTARFLALEGVDDMLRKHEDLDEHAAFLQKRWNHQVVPARLRALVGNTPMVAISFRFMGARRILYAKCEMYNMTGSIKDRMALHILEEAHASGSLKPGDLIIEASSGNSGISFAAMGRALGHPVGIYMPDWMSAERKALLRSFGAQLVCVSALQGGFVGSIRLAQDAQRKHRRVFLPEQFSNKNNPAVHELTTGPEIILQLASVGAMPAAFVAGVGTGGTVMGVSRALRSLPEIAGSVKVHPMEPAESPTLSRGCHRGHHR